MEGDVTFELPSDGVEKNGLTEEGGEEHLDGKRISGVAEVFFFFFFWLIKEGGKIKEMQKNFKRFSFSFTNFLSLN